MNRVAAPMWRSKHWALKVYSGKQMPYDALAAGIGDYRIITTFCPGEKEPMRRLMDSSSMGVNLEPLLTHPLRLDDIVDAYALFGERHDGVLKSPFNPNRSH